MKTPFKTRLIRIVFLFVALFCSYNLHAQLRQIYLDVTAPDNEIHKISFYSASEGYLATTNWIGFTQDSGRTIARRYITPANVNYNGYNVNLTFGFAIKGVVAFNKDTINVFGHYGLVPAILQSVDQGNTYKLVFHSQYNSSVFATGIMDMVFPANTTTGYAVDADRILKTNDGGKTWGVIKDDPGSFFDHLEAVNNNIVFAMAIADSYNKLLKTSNGGISWQPVTMPPGQMMYTFFLTSQSGWINMYNDNKAAIYYSGDGGDSWQIKNDPAASPFACKKMKFINEQTGFGLENLFEVYKTTDSGKTWEPLQRDNNFSYLGFTMNDLQFSGSNQFWAGGGHGFLELTTNAGGTTLPKAYFKIDTSSFHVNKTVQLLNYSKSGYQCKWFRDNVQIGNSFNASYTRTVYKETDTLKMIVSNGVYSDTTVKYLHFPFVNFYSFNPLSAASGETVTITGSGFDNAVSVKFGDVEAASFTIISSTEIKAIVGGGNSGNITITGQGGLASQPGFTYIPSPVISSFTPSVAGIGTTVTISGYNLVTTSAVSFGGVPAISFKVVSDNTVTAIVNTGASGNISLTTSAGTISKAGFVFKPTPAISSFSPASGSAGTLITISGINFSSIISENIVFIGEQRATVTAASPTSLTVMVAAGATSKRILVTVNGLSAESATPFNIMFPGGELPLYTSSFESALKIIPGYSMPGLGNSAASDFDGDGKCDIATIHENDKKVLVYLNTTTNGKISFEKKLDLASLFGVTFISAKDLNGDGKPELIINNGNSTSVFKNNSVPGSLLFGSRADYDMGNGSIGFPAEPVSFCVGDIDKDGRPDIAACCMNYNAALTILQNTGINGEISFSAPKKFAAFSNGGVSKMMLTDFDGDGLLDAALPSISNNKVAVFRNKSTPGVISFATVIGITASGTENEQIAAADLNDDQKPDIIVVAHSNNSVVILFNTSTAGVISFSSSVQALNGVPGNFHRGLFAEDFSGDGKPDIGLTNYIGNGINGISLFRNTSTAGSVSFDLPVHYTTGNYSIASSLADFNADGRPDVYISCQVPGEVNVLSSKIGDPRPLELCKGGIANFVASLSGSNYQWQVNEGSGFLNVVEDANHTGVHTATLDLTATQSSWYGRQYRCVVDGNNSQIYSLKFTNVWTGAIDNNWENPTNWSCNTLPDANTDVIIPTKEVILNSTTEVHSILIKSSAKLIITTGQILNVLH